MDAEWRLALNRTDVRVVVIISNRVNATPDDLRALAHALTRIAGLADAIAHLAPAAVPRAASGDR